MAREVERDKSGLITGTLVEMNWALFVADLGRTSVVATLPQLKPSATKVLKAFKPDRDYSPQDIAEKIKMDPSHVRTAVNDLVAHGLLERAGERPREGIGPKHKLYRLK